MSSTRTIEKLKEENAALRKLLDPNKESLGDVLVKALGESVARKNIAGLFIDALLDEKAAAVEKAKKEEQA